jgi:4-phytase / acid phosphatase
MSQLRWLICTLVLVTTALAQDPPKLKMAVIVTRHGVRPPLDKNPRSPYAKDPWPSLKEWGARCAGDLTETGVKLATLMGAYYREHYIERGLLPKACPSNQVFIWADAEERTWETSKALATGLSQRFPGCDVKVHAVVEPPDESCEAKNPPDYFFHPMAKFKADPVAIDNVINDIKKQLPRLREKYEPELASLQKVVMCCNSEGPDKNVCSPLQSCTLLTLPDKFSLDDKNNTFKWTGPFSVGSTGTENLLLEYADNLKCGSVGWGRAGFHYTTPDCGPSDAPKFRHMQGIHTLYFQLVNRNPYLAKIQGSNLANQVLLKLKEGAAGKSSTPLVIYGGHDTSIANLAGMFDLHWFMTDLPADDTPPAGALVFELYQGTPADGHDGQFVMIRYVHATMAQLRRQSVLSLSDPPEWTVTEIPNCKHPCSFDRFANMMNRAIDKSFTTSTPNDK